MTDENKEVETTVQPASTEQAVETNVETTTTEPAATQETNTIDYKAELDKAQEQIKKAEATIVETKRENKELKNANSTTDQTLEFTSTEEELQNRILTEAEKIADSKLQAFKNDILGDVLNEELGKVSSNPDEQALIKFHYDNTIRQSGASRASIASDLETARAIANKKRLEKENQELKASLVAKNTTGKGSTGTNQDRAENPTVTDEDRRIANKYFGGDVQRYLKTKK